MTRAGSGFQATRHRFTRCQTISAPDPLEILPSLAPVRGNDYEQDERAADGEPKGYGRPCPGPVLTPEKVLVGGLAKSPDPFKKPKQ